MERFVLVCLGSAVGGGARYLVSGWALKAFGAGFPIGTLAVNLLGSFLLAGLMVVGTEAVAMSPNVRLALTTGVMGGFTTYSTFSYDTMRYFQQGAWGTAIGNVLVTVVGCLVACWLGWAAGRWLLGAVPSIGVRLR
jgi:CrcB protein